MCHTACMVWEPRESAKGLLERFVEEPPCVSTWLEDWRLTIYRRSSAVAAEICMLPTARLFSQEGDTNCAGAKGRVEGSLMKWRQSTNIEEHDGLRLTVPKYCSVSLGERRLVLHAKGRKGLYVVETPYGAVALGVASIEQIWLPEGRG